MEGTDGGPVIGDEDGAELVRDDGGLVSLAKAAGRINSRSIVIDGFADSGLVTQRSLASPVDSVRSPLSRKGGSGMGEGPGVRASPARGREKGGTGVLESAPGIGAR